MAKIAKPPSITIKKRGKSWVVGYRDPSSGRRPRKTFKTHAQAKAYKDKLVETWNRGLFDQLGADKPKERLLTDAILTFYQNRSAKTAYAKTAKRILKRFYRYMRLWHRVHLLDDLDMVMIETFQTSRSRRVSNATVNREFDLIHALLNACVEWKWIEESPAAKLPRLSSHEPEREHWEPGVFRQIFDCLPQDQQDCLSFMGQTGCRNGEYIRLKFKDVARDYSSAQLTSFKGDGSARRRRVPLTLPVQQIIRRRHQVATANGVGGREDFVFATPKGEPFGRCSLAQAVRRARKVLKQEHNIDVGSVTPYGLRHTIATQMANKNVLAAQKMLGHSQLRTTQNYVKFSQDVLNEALTDAAANIIPFEKVDTKRTQSDETGNLTVEKERLSSSN